MLGPAVSDPQPAQKVNNMCQGQELSIILNSFGQDFTRDRGAGKKKHGVKKHHGDHLSASCGRQESWEDESEREKTHAAENEG